MSEAPRRWLEPTPFEPSGAKLRRRRLRAAGAAAALLALALLAAWWRWLSAPVADQDRLAASPAPVDVGAEGEPAAAERPEPPAPAPLASLQVLSEPAGAHVLVELRYRGRTPLSVSAPPGTHAVWLFLSGHRPVEREVTLRADATERVAVTLRASTGSLLVETEPAGVRFEVAGRRGTGPRRQLSLPAGRHAIRAELAGHEPHRATVRVFPGLTSRHAIRPRAKATRSGADESFLNLKYGLRLRLVRPSNFFMGSRRGESGRRSNETRRWVIMRRPYYLGVAEVSNAQWKRFDPEHDSGAVMGIRLDQDDLPVVNVSWRQAARYCNWLSAEHGLAAFYATDSNGEVTGVAAGERTGFRLPTEAEWSFAARAGAERPERPFPWGDGLPPPDGAGNFADRSAGNLARRRLESYRDGHAATAPVNSGEPDRNGLLNLAGNVSEWTHDFYRASPGDAGADPLGPNSGAGHVVRGSSWRSADRVGLRIAYREREDQARPTIGLRVARWAPSAEAAQ